MDLTGIEAIIFDLGGVIVDIDYHKTYEKLKHFSANPIPDLDTLLVNESIFKQYETGVASEEEFFLDLSRILGTKASKMELEEAWNAMILGIPEDRLNLVKSLGDHYRLFVFSNTNTTHIRRVNTILKSGTGVESFSDFFDKVFYSHELGKRKPDEDAFRMVLKEVNTLPRNTLFIDDNPENVVSAEKLGIRGWHLKEPGELMDYFKNGTRGKEISG